LYFNFSHNNKKYIVAESIIFVAKMRIIQKDNVFLFSGIKLGCLFLTKKNKTGCLSFISYFDKIILDFACQLIKLS
jgi:hypothetical protein